MNTAVMDYQSALERIGGDNEFLVELLDEMMLQLDDGIETIKKAIAESDFETLKRTAHGLKGAAANLEINHLAELFKELEMLGGQGTSEGADRLLRSIAQGRDDLEKFLSTI